MKAHCRTGRGFPVCRTDRISRVEIRSGRRLVSVVGYRLVVRREVVRVCLSQWREYPGWAAGWHCPCGIDFTEYFRHACPAGRNPGTLFHDCACRHASGRSSCRQRRSTRIEPRVAISSPWQCREGTCSCGDTPRAWILARILKQVSRYTIGLWPR